MHALLVPIGSAGDVLPFVALGRRLAARGAAVTLATNETFREIAERAGLEFVSLGTREQYDALTRHPDLWHPTRSARLVFRWVLGATAAASRELLPLVRPGSTVVIAGTLAFAARFAAEKRGVPSALVHLQPAMIPSAHHVPVTPGGRELGWLPRWSRRLLLGAVERLMLHPAIRGPLNGIRREMGLTPIRVGLFEWWNGAPAVVGLFPDWFAPPQPDWPRRVTLTGFPVWGGGGLQPLPERLEAFLSDGEPPVVLSPGSANRHAAAPIAAAVDVLRERGRRGLILTPFRDQVPDPLPPRFAHFDYAPFEEVVPRAAALVHHGGIGTVSQALAAGVVQLVHPFAFDQPDNALRVARLGAGLFLPLRRFHGAALRAAFDRLFGDADLAEGARACAHRMSGVDAVGETVDVIEALAIRS